MMLLLGAWGLVRVTMLFGALLAELPSAYQITLSLVPQLNRGGGIARHLLNLYAPKPRP